MKEEPSTGGVIFTRVRTPCRDVLVASVLGRAPSSYGDFPRCEYDPFAAPFVESLAVPVNIEWSAH